MIKSKLSRQQRRSCLFFIAGFLFAQASISCAKELSGTELRCCVLVESPVVEKEVNGGEAQFSGLAIDYLQRLQDILGFECKTLHEYGSPEAPAPKGKEGFTGFVENMAECAVGNDTTKCPCDIGTAGIAETDKRFGLVDFVSPSHSDTFSIGQSVNTLEAAGGGWLIFKPFSVGVWIGVASIIILLIFVHQFDREFAATNMENMPPSDISQFERFRWTLMKTKLLRRIRLGFFSTAFSMIGHVSPGEDTARRRQHKSPSTRQKTISLVGNLMGLFWCSPSKLSRAPRGSQFRTIKDFKNCRLNASELCIPAGGASQGFWDEAVAPERALDCPNDKPDLIESSVAARDIYEESMRKAVSNEPGSCKFVLSATSTLQSASRGEYCGTLTVVGDPFFSINSGFVLPKGSSLTDPFSRETLKLHRRDLLESPLDVANKLKCDYSNTGTVQLNWSLLGIFFYVSWTGLALILLLMILLPEPVTNSAKDDGQKLNSPEDGSPA